MVSTLYVCQQSNKGSMALSLNRTECKAVNTTKGRFIWGQYFGYLLESFLVYH